MAIIIFYTQNLSKMIINFKKLYINSELPRKGSEEAACYDVIAHSIEFDYINDLVKVSLGFATELPRGYKACIVPRSSLSKFPFIIPNSPGQIDSDYRGEWVIKFRYLNPTHKPLDEVFPYEEGDRVAQMWVEKVTEFEIEEIPILSETERGEGGFGSTGKK